MKRIFAGVGFATLLGFAAMPGAKGASDILALDEPAITVKAPASVFLDTIARAGDRLVAAGEHGVIIYSDDNGKHWQQSQVPVDVTLTALAFATLQSGWAVGNSGVILSTTDSGKNWAIDLTGSQANQLMMQAAQNMPPDNSRFPGAPNAVHRAAVLLSNGASIPFLSLLPINAQTVLAFGAYRMTMRSSDGGKSWADWSLRVGDPVSHHLYGCAFVGSDIYLVSETGLVFRSVDNGETFPAVTPAGNATLFGVTGTGDGVLVYGVAGEAFKSTDQGKSWTKITVPTSANLMAADTLPSGAILLADESGTLFISHNHGASFSTLPVNLPMALFAFAPAADGDIVVAGNRGIMTIPAAALN